MIDCIFCKIIAGELPSWKVYEDDHAVAFLDIHPVHEGHTLVVPKKHCTDFVSADENCLRSVIVATQKVARAVLAATEAGGVNITTANGSVAGQSVFHLHWHVMPRFENDGFRLWPQSTYADTGVELMASEIKKWI
ncbi:HIT family protein [Candidatus Uhrbacteria bacterium]|nr:HIT family protein [Candidatus Uhrbacteria bacterium]